MGSREGSLFFSNIICTSSHSAPHSTERILKTFFYFTKHTDKDLDGDKLLVDPVYYMKFVAMCNSKLCNNRAAKLRKVSKSKIMSFLARSQWVRGKFEFCTWLLCVGGTLSFDFACKITGPERTCTKGDQVG